MWPLLQNDLSFHDNEVTVVAADLDQVNGNRLANFSAVLSADELDRASRFRFDQDRNRFVAAKGILRLLVAGLLRIEPASVRFEMGKHGKPFLGAGEFEFNISHSDRLAVFAFSKSSAVGVDVECVSRKVEYKSVAEKFFCKAEFEKLVSLPPAQLELGFFNCWTRKEAFIKAVGEGLSYPLDRFEVTLKPDEEAVFIEIEGITPQPHEWGLRSFVPEEGFVGALAVNGEIQSLVCRRWDDEVSYSSRI